MDEQQYEQFLNQQEAREQLAEEQQGRDEYYYRDRYNKMVERYEHTDFNQD